MNDDVIEGLMIDDVTRLAMISERPKSKFLSIKITIPILKHPKTVVEKEKTKKRLDSFKQNTSELISKEFFFLPFTLS
jgi:hypothetical protein